MSILRNVISSTIGRRVTIFGCHLLSIINEHIYKNKRILFYAPENKFLTDNSKALYDYLIENKYNESYQIICCIPKTKLTKDERIVTDNVKIVGIVTGIIYYLTTKYVFYSFGSMRIKAGKNQLVFNLGHGTPLKSLGSFQVKKKYGQEDTNDFTFALATSEYFRNIISTIHQCSINKIIIQGHARNDYLFNKADSFQKLKIDKNKYNKTILWMPTFRVLKNRYNDLGDDATQNETLLPLLSSYDDLNMMNNFLSNNNIFLAIKIHPGANFEDFQYSNIKLYTNDVLNKSEVELYEFVKEFDSLLTDYSSIFFDYLLLDKPIGFTIDDFELYKKNRGFSVEDPLSLMPGHHIKSINELKQYLLDILNENDSYKDKRVKVNNIVNHYKDGKNRKRLLDYAGIIKS